MRRPLRIAISTESYLPYLSGVTVSVETLARGLTSLGHAVLLLAPRAADGESPPASGGGPDPEYAWLPSYEPRGLVPSGYRMPLPFPWVIAAAVHRFQPDVVHAQSPFVSGLMSLGAARRGGVPLVLTHHTRFGDYRHYLGPLARPAASVLEAYLQRFRASCTAVVAPSEAIAGEIRAAHAGRPRPIVRAIATGVDVRAIQALAPLDPRPAGGWPTDAIVAVTLGRLALEKNVRLLFEAFAIAARRIPELRLLVIGSGPAEPELRRRAQAADLRGRVAFTGLLPRPDALARLRCCDLFVFASRTETQGLVLAEATACGLPTVALHGPAVGETVRDGLDGVLVTATGSARDGPALGEAIAELALDRERRRAMAGAATEDASRLDVSVSLARMVELYGEVLQ